VAVNYLNFMEKLYCSRGFEASFFAPLLLLL